MSLKTRKQSRASFIYLLNVHNFLCWRILSRLLMVLPRASLSFIQAALRRYARPVCSILSAPFLKRIPTHRFALRQLVLSPTECKIFTGADKDTVWCSVDVSEKKIAVNCPYVNGKFAELMDWSVNTYCLWSAFDVGVLTESVLFQSCCKYMLSNSNSQFSYRM